MDFPKFFDFWTDLSKTCQQKRENQISCCLNKKNEDNRYILMNCMQINVLFF